METSAVYMVDVETPREAHTFRSFELTADSILEAYRKAETFADETRGEFVRGVNPKQGGGGLVPSPAATLRKLHAAAQNFEAARQRRDALIRNAHEAGIPAPAIAEAVGLTRGRIYQLLDR